MKNPSPRNFQIAVCGALGAQAIALSYLESLLPPLAFLPPGVKLGLSNIVTMFAAAFMGLPYAVFLTILKSMFIMLTGGVTTGFISLCGGICSTFIMWLLLRVFKRKNGMIGVGAAGGVTHNIGQLMGAVIITKTVSLYTYLPLLLVFGVLTGILTGLILRLLLPALQMQSVKIGEILRGRKGRNNTHEE